MVGLRCGSEFRDLGSESLGRRRSPKPEKLQTASGLWSEASGLKIWVEAVGFVLRAGGTGRSTNRDEP